MGIRLKSSFLYYMFHYLSYASKFRTFRKIDEYLDFSFTELMEHVVA